MPGQNGNGPQNEGPMTGRGLGRCRPADNLASNSNFNDPLRKVNPNEVNPEAGINPDPVVYGRGQGGLPRGGGQGLGQGRGMGQGQGQGRGNGGRGRGRKQ